MLISRILLLIPAWHLGRCAEFSLTKNANNFGPYVITFKNYEECKGPKATNATTMFFKVINKDALRIAYNTTFHVNARLSEIKINVWRIDGTRKSVLWNYKVDKPCQHFAITSALAQYFHVQQNCVVKKGEFYYEVSLYTMAQKFFGESFFYGDFIFKTVLLSNQGNVMCCVVNMSFVKKQS